MSWISKGLASIVYKLFDRNTEGNAVKSEIMENKGLAEELHKPIIRNFEKRKINSSFIGNIWGAYLAYMQLLSKFDKGICFLFCVIDIYGKYAIIIPLKDKKGITVIHAFQKILDESGRKPNKIWVDQVSEFYNTSVKLWLKKNDIEMYSANNEGKSVAAERIIRNLKNNLQVYDFSINKCLYR